MSVPSFGLIRSIQGLRTLKSALGSLNVLHTYFIPMNVTRIHLDADEELLHTIQEAKVCFMFS